MNIDPSNPLRWHDPHSFSEDWASRSAELLSIADRTIAGPETLSFSEYGCGPLSPFAQAVGLASTRRVHRYDLRVWDDGVDACNLNDHATELARTDVGVLSGVAEYLDDVEGTLRYLSRFHRFLLASYAFRFTDRASGDHKAEIDRRLNVNGWINHFSEVEFIAACSADARVLHVSTWNRHQLLTLLEFRNR